MPKVWTNKQEREYEHIRDSQQSRGASTRRAKEIAARTVNKNRAQSGRSRTAGRSTIQDVSPQHRGGKRSHSGPQGPTRDQLYNEARQRNIEGRSKMNKSQLAHAVGRD